VKRVSSHRFPQDERDAFWGEYNKALAQMDLPIDSQTGREIKPLKPPDFRFKVRFACDDPTCEGNHQFSVLDWEADALYFNLRQRGDAPDQAAAKVVSKIRDQICTPDKDLYFFLGNISTHPQMFTVVGFWWPKKPSPARQPPLMPLITDPRNEP